MRRRPLGLGASASVFDYAALAEHGRHWVAFGEVGRSPPARELLPPSLRGRAGVAEAAAAITIGRERLAWSRSAAIGPGVSSARPTGEVVVGVGVVVVRAEGRAAVVRARSARPHVRELGRRWSTARQALLQRRSLVFVGEPLRRSRPPSLARHARAPLLGRRALLSSRGHRPQSPATPVSTQHSNLLTKSIQIPGPRHSRYVSADRQ